jgi:hypothetical protein
MFLRHENANTCIGCWSGGKDEKEIEEKLNQWNLIIKEYTLKWIWTKEWPWRFQET